MENAITEIKSTLEGTSSRITEAEERISEVEDRMVEINEAEWKTGKKQKQKQNKTKWRQPQGCLENVKHHNIWITGVQEENKRKGHEKIFEELIVKKTSLKQGRK